MQTTATTPTSCPFGEGDPIMIVVPADVETCHGNVSVPAGTYTAWQSTHAPEGTVSLWSEHHYAAGDRGGMWTSIPPWLWAFPGEAPRPLPEHVCLDNLRSGVAGGIFCGICNEEMG